MTDDITVCSRESCKHGVEDHNYIDTGDLSAPRMPCNLCDCSGYLFVEPEIT